MGCADAKQIAIAVRRLPGHVSGDPSSVAFQSVVRSFAAVSFSPGNIRRSSSDDMCSDIIMIYGSFANLESTCWSSFTQDKRALNVVLIAVQSLRGCP